MRAKLDSLAVREDKQARVVEDARNRFNESNAAYEALREISTSQMVKRPWLNPKKVSQVGVSFAMFALLLLLGVPLFQQGRAAGSLSYASLGLVMICFGMLLAVTAVVLMFKPDRRRIERRERLEYAQQIMLQDKSRLESALADEQALQDHITGMLADMGLGEAGSSIRRARVLLDEARVAREAE